MALNILICIKSVALEASEGGVQRSIDLCALNPFDLPVIETALGLREMHGGSITAVSMGPDSAEMALYEAMSMGIDRAVLLNDPALAGSDTFATSTALGTALMKLAPYDLILFGTRTSDSDTGQVGPQTAIFLDLPMVTGVFDISVNGSGIIVERKIDDFIEKYNVSLPAALTIHRSRALPRDASLMGIEATFGQEKPERMNIIDLGLSPDLVGETGSPTKILSTRRISKERKCEFIEGQVEEQAEKLVMRLKETGFVG